MLCSDCCLSRDVFDSTVAKVEEEFPDYRYRDPEEVRIQKKQQLDKEREVRFQIIDSKGIPNPDTQHPDESVTKAIEYKKWRDLVLAKPDKEKEKGTSKKSKQAS
ncbi:hypothetical protein WA577_001096, partial [Blastocystis sp. JDR]